MNSQVSKLLGYLAFAVLLFVVLVIGVWLTIGTQKTVSAPVGTVPALSSNSFTNAEAQR